MGVLFKPLTRATVCVSLCTLVVQYIGNTAVHCNRDSDLCARKLLETTAAFLERGPVSLTGLRETETDVSLAVSSRQCIVIGDRPSVRGSDF